MTQQNQDAGAWLDDLKRKVQELRGGIKDRTDSAAAGVSKGLDDLDRRIDEARTQARQKGELTQSAWSELKRGLSNAWSEAKAGFERARSQMKS